MFVAAKPVGWHCGDEQGPGAAMWSTWRIGPGPDGALAGTVTEVGADACPGMRTRAFGLASGGQPVDVPDPELEAARVVSPAHGLRGRYAWSNARRDVPDLPPAAVGYDVTTQCLRGGDRCVSVFVGEPGRVDGRLPVVAVNFADGAWTQLSADATLTCSAGGTATGTRRYLLALPAAPVPDPIERLSGEVLAEFTDGDCPNSFTFDATLSRTGD